jgi:hypothetical protein
MQKIQDKLSIRRKHKKKGCQFIPDSLHQYQLNDSLFD